MTCAIRLVAAVEPLYPAITEAEIVAMLRRHLEERATGALEQIKLGTEIRLILEALDATGGRVSEAAMALGISRPALYVKMRQHGITLQ